MRIKYAGIAGLLFLLPCASRAQTGFIGPDGASRYPGVTILCPNGTRAAPCNFSGGGGGGTVTINLGSAPVSATNTFPVNDPLLDAAMHGGALGISGTVGIGGGEVSAPGVSGTQAVTVQGAASGVALPVSGTFWPATQPVSATSLPLPAGAATSAAQAAVQSAPGTSAITALTVQGAAGGVVMPVSCSSGCAGTNASVSPTGTAPPTAATQIALPNAAGNLSAPVLTADGGLPAHVINFPSSQAVTGTFWQSTQPTADTALDALVSGGTLAVSAAALPLPAGAAKASYQTAPQASVAPAAATATASLLLGCQSNTTLPSFTAGQQGAVPCDTSGRLYVVTIPSANNVPTYLQAISSGGAYTSRAINTAASAMATVVKTSAGLLYGYEVCNSSSAAIYFRIFNLGVAPTVGTSIPAISKVVGPANCQSFSTDLGLTFGTGIAFDATAGSLADSDTTTVAAANQVAVEIYSH
jgi:hypothetical protein